MENKHYVVQMFSNLWWLGLLFSICFIILCLYLGRKMQAGSRKKLEITLGSLFLFLAVAIHFYEWYTGVWNLQKSLPLQLCALSGILSGFVFFRPNQRVYELLVFWGIPGAFHSFLTPEMTHGSSHFIIVDYYVSHAGIILAALYIPFVMGINIRKNSWVSSFIFTLGVVIVTGIINWGLKANYMYLREKPMADNLMIIGEWPWYVFVLLALGMLHFYFVYMIFKAAGWVNKAS